MFSKKSRAKSFTDIWHGGYFEGDPLKPLEPSSYGLFGYSSTLHLIYQACIKPYVDGSTTVLEIGPGRGAFTKCFAERGAKKIYAVDAASAEHTRFWDYVGRPDSIEYHVAQDSSLRMVPDNSVDYVFSFGCLCHTPSAIIEGYIQALATKMRPGARGFLMVADYDKLTHCLSHPELFSIERALRTRRTALAGAIVRLGYRLKPYKIWVSKNETEAPRPGRFFNYGTDRACAFLEKNGFAIVERDVGVNHRDPLIHFHRHQ